MRFLVLCLMSTLQLLGDTGRAQTSGTEKKRFYGDVFAALRVVTAKGSSAILTFGGWEKFDSPADLEVSADLDCCSFHRWFLKEGLD